MESVCRLFGMVRVTDWDFENCEIFLLKANVSFARPSRIV